MLLSFLLLFFTNIILGSGNTSSTLDIASIKALATELSAAGHDVHLTINSLTNENTQTTTVSIIDYHKLIKDGSEKFKFGARTIWEYIKNNKKRVFLNGMALTYVSLQMRLWHLKSKLRNIKCWSQAQSNKKIEELYQIPQNTLSDNLLKDIQKVYMQLDNPANFVQPIMCFIKDTEREEQILEEYSKIVKWADKLYLKSVIFYDKNLVAEIPTRLNKIAYYKNCLLNWLAEFKAAHPIDFINSKR